MVVAFCAWISSVSIHAAPPSGAGWNLAWNDEFNGTSLDTSKWNHWLAGPRRDAVNSPSAVSVADGILTISTYTSGGTHYTGMIATHNTYLYTYGYIEARINYDSTPGMWSAFWMQSPTMGNPIGSPNSAGTEIDICEHRKVDGSGVNRDGNIGGVIHWDGYGTAHRSHGYDSGNLGLGNGYHIYGMEWTPTQQKFYINGILRWTINNNPANSPVSQRSEFIVLSSEVLDGGWSSTVPAGGYGTLATTTTKMEVDYVRVYRRAETVVNGDFEGKIGPFSAANQATWSATGGNSNPAAARLAPTSSAGATVSQSVRGLLPDTGYSVTTWGNAGVTAPSLTVGANSHGGAQVSQTSSNSSYTRSVVPFTTGLTNRTATVFAKSNNSGSLAYVDDFLLRRHATVNNGQLENGESDAWNSVYGGAIVSGDSTYDGEFAWKIPASGSSAGVEQEVVGLTPNTSYRLSGWTTNGNTGLTFGVKNHGPSQVTSTVSSGSWTRATVNFTTGSSNTSATVFAFRPSSAQAAYADSFFLYQPLVAPWVNQDVSNTGLSGIAGRLGGKLLLQAGGSNLGGTADQMHFLHQPVTGDATITARILGVDTAAYHAKSGVMIRESTAVGARSASISWGPVNQLADFNYRTTTNGTAVSSSTARDLVDPPWLRLTRRGNTFRAYHSPDGIAWTRVGQPQTISMSANALIGIPACSGDPSRLAEAALDNVMVSAAVPDVLITSPTDGSTLSGNGQGLHLTASITDSGTPAIAWSMAGGPGTVAFSNPSQTETSATFSLPGTYRIRGSATTAAGIGSDEITVHVAPVSASDPAMVLRLKLDETGGTQVSDVSGSNNLGTTSGGLVWQPSGGQVTGAAAFNGADSYIAVPDNASLDNTTAFTLSFWFRANSFNNSGLVAKRISFDNQNSYGTFLGLDGKLNVDISSNNNRFTSATTFNTGAWYHVAVVFDGSLVAAERARLYVNGTLDKTATETSTSIPNHTSALHIGTLFPSNPVFDGLIDDVRFHRRALSAMEIAALDNETDTHLPTVSTGTAPAAIVNIPTSLTGSVSVESGPAASSLWTKISGPGNVTFANPASPATSATFDQPGDYVLRLTATSPTGQTFAELNDTIFAASLPPPVVTTQPASSVYLADTMQALRLIANVATSGVPGAPDIAWSQISGPGIATFSNNTSETHVSFPSPGTYLLRCTVTNAGGSDTADISVSVVTPVTTTFRQGENGYSHVATFIRADSTAWNSGARDQMLIGKSLNGPAFRSVLSFPLTGIPANATLTSVSLDVRTHDTTAGIGTMGSLELRTLNAPPTEGTGNSSSDPANGAGTGTTWNNRTNTIAWTSAGGDFSSTVLSSVGSFNATTLDSAKSFPSSSAFVAAAQAAVSNGQALNLMLHSPATESGGNNIYTRIASDDHASPGTRPFLSVIWTNNPAPIVHPGSSPPATAGEPADLAGFSNGSTSTNWTLVSGPGSATFANPSLPITSVTLSHPGTYILRLAAANSNAEVSRTLSINVAPNPNTFSGWQTLTWPETTAPEITGPDMDPDQDSIPNLLEWALHLNPKLADGFQPVVTLDPATIQFSYTRRKTGPGEADFQVLWSDTLGDDWSDESVSSETLVSETGTTQTVSVSLPATPDRRFVRVRVTKP